MDKKLQKRLNRVANVLEKLAASRTYKVARNELLQKFAENGWKISDPNLKVTHATSPDGTLRLWFRAQAVYFTKAHNKKHTFSDARTLSYDLDIRKYDPQKFVDYINRIDEKGLLQDRHDGVSASFKKIADKDILIRDNQNVDLDAFKRQMQKEKEHREKVNKEQSKRFQEDQKRFQEAGWQRPDWQQFKGRDVIRVADEPYIAIPNSGRRNAKNFVVVDIRLLNSDEDPIVTNLKKDELFKWFFATWKREHGF